MHAFDVLGDPVRRRILELLADGEQSSGAITAVVQAEFGITQPAVSQHLKVLRDSGFATVRPDGTRRLYAVDATPLREVEGWLGPLPRVLGAAPRLARDRARPRQAGAPPDRRHARPAEGDHPMIDVVHEIEAVQREVGTGRIAAGEGPCPASGDLRRPDRRGLGRPDGPGPDRPLVPADQRRLPARRDLPVRGQRGGEIVACDRPNRLKVTWMHGAGGAAPPSGGRGPSPGCAATTATVLQLEHVAVVPDEFWDQYGPGAVGVGWEGGFLGLALHLRRRLRSAIRSPGRFTAEGRASTRGAARPGARRAAPRAPTRRRWPRTSRTRPRSTRRIRTRPAPS